VARSNQSNASNGERRREAQETGMQKPTFEECIAGAWRDACDFVRESPLFIVLSIAALFFIRLLQEELRARPTPHSLAILFATASLWIIRLLLLNIINVQAVRYVLLDRTNSWVGFIGRDFWRYFGLLYGLLVSLLMAVIVCIVLLVITWHLLGLHGHERALSMTGGCAAMIAAAWVNLRLSLLPSHAAIGRRLSWRAAWRDTHGHCIAIVGINLGIALTVCAGAALFGGLGALIALIFHDGRNGPVMELVLAVASVLGLVVCASGWGWVYRRYAVALIEHSRLM
jgi:hypothetical protein